MTARRSRKSKQLRCVRCGFPFDRAAPPDYCPECGLARIPVELPPPWGFWHTAGLLCWPFALATLLCVAGMLILRSGHEDWAGGDFFCGGFFFGYLVAPLNTVIVAGIRTGQVVLRREGHTWGARWIIVTLSALGAAILSTVICFGCYLFANAPRWGWQ